MYEKSYHFFISNYVTKLIRKYRRKKKFEGLNWYITQIKLQVPLFPGKTASALTPFLKAECDTWRG